MGSSLDSWDLKKWRKRLGYNQVEAAEALDVHRGAVQNWESEIRPIPLAVKLACEEIERQQKPTSASVVLICTDGPIAQPSMGPYQVSLLRCETFEDCDAAIEAFIQWRLDPAATNPLIFSAADGSVVWDTDELTAECRKRLKL
jgi:DNA-binding XRE family transcriptional regulator